MKNNFKAWLGEQKKLWKNHKINTVIDESMKFQEMKSILQVIPMANAPGSFTVWYYSGSKIQQLLLNFKRHYYVMDKRGTKKAPRDEGAACEIIID